MKKWIAVLLLLIPAFATASTKWFIYEAQNNTCISAKHAVAIDGLPQLITPLQLRDYLRMNHPSTYGGYRVYHLGSQRGVAIKNEGRYIYYFTSIPLCEKYAVDPLNKDGQGLSELR